MLKYDVECDASLDELIKLVNNKINRGRQLVGGIATMTHQPRYTFFYQAMIKEDKPKEKYNLNRFLAAQDSRLLLRHIILQKGVHAFFEIVGISLNFICFL